MLALGIEQYGVTVERNVAVKTRDGVTLRADVYRPKTEGQFPVLLQRTPYDKSYWVDLGYTGAARVTSSSSRTPAGASRQRVNGILSATR